MKFYNKSWCHDLFSELVITGSAPVFPSHAGAQQGSVGRVSSQRQRHGQRQNGPAAKPDPDQQAGSRTQAPAQAGQHHRPLQALPLSAQHGQHQVGRRVRERVSSVRMKKIPFGRLCPKILSPHPSSKINSDILHIWFKKTAPREKSLTKK